jgi:hypothetical protein
MTAHHTMIKHRSRYRAIIYSLRVIAVLAPTLPCAAAGLWDLGFVNGTWRSDLDRPGLGTLIEPFAYAPTCRFPATPFAL